MIHHCMITASSVRLINIMWDFLALGCTKKKKKKNPHQCQICACTSQLGVCDTLFPLIENNRSMVFVQWLITHTPVWLCLCVFVFADSLQSQFLIEFAPPAGAPGKERHCQRLTVSYPAQQKQNTHICTRERVILSIWALLLLIACFSFPVFDSWSGEISSSAQKGDGTPSWTGELSSVMCLKDCVRRSWAHLNTGDPLNTVIKLCWTKHRTHFEVFSTKIRNYCQRVQIWAFFLVYQIYCFNFFSPLISWQLFF